MDARRVACAAGEEKFALAAGWSVKRVQVELGHSDPAFTLRVYGHLWPEEIDTGRTQLDALLATSVGPHTDLLSVEDPAEPRG